MTRYRIEQFIKKDMKSYDDFNKYINDAGWQDWMNEYVEGEEPTEEELRYIESIQYGVFKECRHKV